MCTRTRRYVFAGYIDENAIHNNFQGVPPLGDGSVCEFNAIDIEMGPSNLTAPFVYQRPCHALIQSHEKIARFMRSSP